MRHFIQLEDWTTDELRALVDDAARLKKEYYAGGNQPILKGKILAMIFQKPSLRTRVSFDVGMQHLGGTAIMLGQNEVGLGKREAISDIARVLSGMVHGIMARVFDHVHLTELARWSSVPIINGLSDDHHPCQVMADVLTIREHFGRTDGLKLAYIGDGNNVAASLLFMCAHFGIDFTIAAPSGYTIPQAVLDAAAPLVRRSEIEFTQVERPEDAAKGADVLYTDTWISMGQEAEAAARRAAFGPGAVRPGEAREVAHIRSRVERESSLERAGVVDVKLGRGGLLDVEFAVQLLQIHRGAELGEDARSPELPRALDALERVGVLDALHARVFRDAWRFFRKVELRLRVARADASAALDERGPLLAPLARRLGLRDYPSHSAAEELLLRHHEVADAVRGSFEEIVESLTKAGAPG